MRQIMVRALRPARPESGYDDAMIGRLKGVVDEVGEDHLILDVAGVGYLVTASTRTLAGLARGAALSLEIETVVREDALRLYGFASRAERDWFRLLTSVQGVGAKVALGLLSTLSPGDLASAVALQDKAAIARAPGVGPRLAQRLVTELKDKAPAFGAPVDPLAARLAGEASPAAPRGALADAVSALVNLGYAQAQAATAVAAAARSADADAAADVLIRKALRELAR